MSGDALWIKTCGWYEESSFRLTCQRGLLLLVHNIKVSGDKSQGLKAPLATQSETNEVHGTFQCAFWLSDCWLGVWGGERFCFLACL